MCENRDTAGAARTGLTPISEHLPKKERLDFIATRRKTCINAGWCPAHMKTLGFSSNLSSVCVYDEKGCTRVSGTAPCMNLPSPPPAESSSSSSACECKNGTRDSRVAVCMTGALRSFTERPVYSSIAANLLHPLRCADLFAVISLLDSGVLTNVKAANSS